MDENKLDKLIEQNITEARILWLDTLPSKGELPRHSFTPRFRMRIRRMAGMKYTLLYFLKLVGVGLVSVFLGYLPMFFAIIPMAPMLFISVTDTFITLLGALSTIIVVPLLVYFVEHFWVWLGEWSRSREINSHRRTVAAAMALPGLTALAYALGSHVELPAWITDSAIYELFAGNVRIFAVLFGRNIYTDLFYGSGGLLWLCLITGVFYAGNREVSLKAFFRPLYAMALFAGFYDAAVLLQLPRLLIWLKVGHLLAAVWAVYGLTVIGKMNKKAKRIVMAAALAAAVLLGVTDLTDSDEIEPRAMPLFAHTMEDIFPGYGHAPLRIRRNGDTVLLEETQLKEAWAQLGSIDLRTLKESSSRLMGGETIDSWVGPLRITIQIEDPEKPCTLTLAQVQEQQYHAAGRVYRLGLAFQDGEEYTYTCDDPALLPIGYFEQLSLGQPATEADGTEARFTFDLSSLDGESIHLAQDIMVSTTDSSRSRLHVEGILTEDTYTCRFTLPENTRFLFLQPPVFQVMTVRNGKSYWETVEMEDYRFECDSKVRIFELTAY